MGNTFVITNPMIAANRSQEVTLSKFVRVIRPCFRKITVVGGNVCVENDLKDIRVKTYSMPRGMNKLEKILSNLLVQLKMLWYVLIHTQRQDKVFFWIADKMVLPFIAASLRGATTYYFLYGNVAKEGVASKFTHFSESLIRWMAERADYICVESASVIDNWTPIRHKGLLVLHLYTDSIQFAPIHLREYIVGMVCRLTPGKHITESIEAFITTHEKHPEWILEIIGSGKQQKECERLIALRNAGEYVKMLGWVEHTKVLDYPKRWRYLLFPTDTEGMPNGLIEIMGLGVPAIASPVGGVKDVVIGERNGFLLNDTKVNSIGAALERAIFFQEDSGRYGEMAQASFNTIQENFSLDAAKNVAKLIFGE